MTPEQFEILTYQLKEVLDSQKTQNGSIKTIAEGLKSVTQNLNTLSTNFNQVCIEMAVTASKLEALRDDFDDETTGVPAHERKIAKNISDIDKANGKIDTITNAINDKKTGLDAHETRITILEGWYQRVLGISAVLSIIVGLVVAKATEILAWIKQ